VQVGGAQIEVGIAAVVGRRMRVRVPVARWVRIGVVFVVVVFMVFVRVAVVVGVPVAARRMQDDRAGDVDRQSERGNDDRLGELDRLAATADAFERAD
jgi:flagellar biosynthesis/type III secretory pathway M-ring protein FliF/YscJ